MNNIWNCASSAWDLVTEAKKHIDAGEFNSNTDEFVMARLKLNETKELLEAIMAETCAKKATNVEAKPVGKGYLKILDGSSLHTILDSYPGEMPSGDPGQRLPSQGERNAELP